MRSYHQMFPPVNSRADLAASFSDSLPPHMIPSTTHELVSSDRAPMSMPIRVTILSRKDCHLCDVVYRIATHLQLEFHIETNKVSIESDRVLMERYGTRVPVVLLDEVEQDDRNPCPIALHQDPVTFDRDLVRFDVEF